MTRPKEMPAWTLIAAGAAILAGLVGLTTWSLSDERDQAIANAYQVSENLAGTLATELRRDFQTYGFSLEGVAERLKLAGIDRLSWRQREAVLFDASARAPQFGPILVIDARGRLALDSTGRLARGMDFSTRRFFLLQRDNPDRGVSITGPETIGAEGGPLILLSRRIDGSDGRFAGVVVGAMRIRSIDRLFKGIVLRRREWVTLVTTSGRIVARAPLSDGDIGRSIRGAALFEHLPKAQSGHYEDTSLRRHGERLYAYAQLGDLPLIVNVSVPRAAVLAGWQRKALVFAGFVGCFIAILAAVGLALQRELRRRALAEQVARESEQRYRLLADNSSDMIVLVRDGKRVYVSPASSRLYGYAPDELIGTAIEPYIHPDDLLALAAAEETVRRDGEVLVTYRARRKDGKPIWVEASWKRLMRPEAATPELVVVARDVTQRVQNEQSLRAAKGHADAANEAKSQFLAHMSHEIRTPMNGILGMDYLLLGTRLNEKQREYVTTIGDAANGLLRIIDDILDESKLEAGKLEIECAEFDLGKTIDDAVSILRPRAAQKNVRLQAAVSLDACGFFCGDAVRLRQILLNIAGNAVKFTDSGHVDIEVSLAGAIGDAAVLRFEISDTGIGIAPEAQASLFESFSQADRSINRRFGGTGLGLSIAKRLVELMGGTIGFSSVPGEGSRFHFEILLDRAAPPTVEPATPAPVTTAVPYRSLDVLLAEDNEVNQQVAQLILTEAGHRVDLADDGRQAVEAVKRKPYDAVLMDIEMPELDGLAAAREIRALPGAARHVPIIALTSHAMAAMRDKVLAAGMDDYIAKPFDAAVLFAKLQHLAAFGKTTGEQAPSPEDNAEAGPTQRFDRDKLDQLCAASNADAFARLRASLVGGVEQHVVAVARLVEEGVFDGARREAHDLVSIAGNVGAMRLSALARELQVACGKAEAEVCRTSVAALSAEAEAVLPLLRDYPAPRAA